MSTYVVLILYLKTNIFRLTFTRVIEIEMPTHPPPAAYLFFYKAKVTSTKNLPTISLAYLSIISVKTNPFISPDD
nr:MAG TPA: hypothetical protein [Caudoviricetes sp.]